MSDFVDLVQALPLTDAGAVGMLILVALLIYTGRLVPATIYRLAIEEKAAKDATISAQAEALQATREVLRKLDAHLGPRTDNTAGGEKPDETVAPED